LIGRAVLARAICISTCLEETHPPADMFRRPPWQAGRGGKTAAAGI